MHSQSLKRISIHNLAFERNNKFLLDNINLTVGSGQLLQVQGPNGSGKSTFLRILAGLIDPHQGSISYDNESVDSPSIHYVGHQNAVKLHLTVRENLQFLYALALQSPDFDHIIDVLKILNLQRMQNTLARYLSCGQLRRLALARLLLHPASLWILDEPATALDSEGTCILVSLLAKHLAAGGIAIVALHQTLDLNYPVQTLSLGKNALC